MTSKTTIQVDEDIVTSLEQLMKEKGLNSYSDTLRELLKESKILRKSEQGILPKLKQLVREKHDRFD